MFKGGFTLIEIMVALAVMGVVIIPVMGLFSSSLEIRLNTSRDIMAITVARDIMDRIKAGDINQSNIEQELYNYKERFGVEIAVIVIPFETVNKNSLSKVKVYVAPRKGMDAIIHGVMLASYSTNVFIQCIDTSPDTTP
ncbi:MAG: prepilin-type N-terminal cleavage/methylation domain-containing protein [Tepidanaerobacteraceae bacterium]|nr:prepilin-type N-terminal cleavage/methylation domain-containing protein [Tepidanaerobacteraceae bacterium]